jgi:hypothetical protein
VAQGGARPCNAAGAAESAKAGTDVELFEGQILDYGQLLARAELFPIEVWRNRLHFFGESARIEIGACHRAYPAAEWYEAATRRHAGTARVSADGWIEGHVAGLPFPRDSIDLTQSDAGARWAWNLERRYRGAGPSGRFRLVDLPSRVGEPVVYTGEWSFVQLAARADLPETAYAHPMARDLVWLSAGRFDEPPHARQLAWRQLRHTSGRDDIFVYVPSLRKVRRAASGWVDGIYVPRFRVTGGGSGATSPTAGSAAAVTEPLARGFEGFALRPEAYRWRVVGERDVLAPINVSHARPGRDFAPSQLAVGNDRWDLRRAVVIQGALRQPASAYDRLTFYVDAATAQPLYMMKRKGARLVSIGVFLHRHSADVAAYPTWPDGSAASVFDPVGAVFIDVAEGGSGWRRESFGVTSVPLGESEVQRLLSSSFLARAR